jgi:hypothetical protein
MILQAMLEFSTFCAFCPKRSQRVAKSTLVYVDGAYSSLVFVRKLFSLRQPRDATRRGGILTICSNKGLACRKKSSYNGRASCSATTPNRLYDYSSHTRNHPVSWLNVA